MALAALAFRSPWGGLVALSILLPVAAALVARRRSLDVAHRLRLRRPRGRTFGVSAVIAAAACALLALAAARPEILAGDERLVRSDSQIVFVVDVSRSMLASDRAGGDTRLHRAKAIVQALRDAVPRVPAGLAGVTDRVLPYAFPTSDAATFAETLRRSVVVENPPPRDVAPVATSFAGLAPLNHAGFFDAGISRRTCVVVTDGETRPFPGAPLGPPRARRGCSLIAVHVGSRTDRVYGEDGLPELEYRADPAARENVARLATSSGGSDWSAADLAGAAGALRAAADAGPTARLGASRETRPLAPFFAGAAFLLAAGLVAAALGGARLLSALPVLRHPPSSS